MVLGAVVALSFSAAAVAATITGTEGDDQDGSASGAIIGTPDNDTISALAGNDVIVAQSGDDTINAGSGDDFVTGDGKCQTYTPPNGQTLTSCFDDPWASRGSDRIFGGSGNDILNGNAGNDRVSGQAGKDKLRGGHGNDRLGGGADSDLLTGQQGNDFLSGASGEDRLLGGSYRDVLAGGRGRDQLFGASGNDMIYARDGQVDVVLCGPGDDTVIADTIDVVGRPAGTRPSSPQSDGDCEQVTRYLPPIQR